MNHNMRRIVINPIFKVIIIIITLLILLIPLDMIDSLIRERQGLANEAAREITDGAGGALKFIGPVFILSYEYDDLDSKGLPRIRKGEVYVLPENFTANGVLITEYRYRGIYRVPVYASEFTLSGSFSMPPNGMFPENARLQDARMIAGFKQMNGIREISPLLWNGTPVPFSSELGNPVLGPGIVTDSLPLPPEGSIREFSWTMEIDGGAKMSITPLGRNSELNLSGDWPSPSFGGSRLPDERSWDETGFTSRWRIPEVSRPVNPYWRFEDRSSETYINQYEPDDEYVIDVSEGVYDMSKYALTIELLDPISSYRQAKRAVKYALLFLFVPFVVFFLFEYLGKIRIHAVQYLLVAATNVVFYILLLAISEHWELAVAYLSASGAVTLLTGIYTWGITKGRLSSLAMPAATAVAYIWLWATLQSEDYALLIGSLGLFVILALIMILTRKVDWYNQALPLEKE